MNKKVFILIAAFNEEKAIGNVIEDLHSQGYLNIVVVDDGSRDGTAAEALKRGVDVLSHIVNRGKGAALQTGTDYILSKDADIIVHFDADGQHRAEDIKHLIKPIIDGSADVVFGSRFLGVAENIPFLRKLLLKLGRIYTNLFFGAALSDTHNGLRAFKIDVFKKIVLTEDRFAYASELVEKVIKNRFLYREVPVNINYSEYSLGKGQKNINAVSIVFRDLKRRIGR
ncbi:MAG: glycosyltransferase family 2 protein [bacterium]